MTSNLNRGVATMLSMFAACHAQAADGIPTTSADENRVRSEFITALQRAHQNLSDLVDSPALKAYVIHDYLTAARLRRDLNFRPGEDLDDSIDSFMQAHAGQPLAHGLRREWLLSLAERRRWDWFLQRSTDATDPQLICERLAGRLATGDTAGLGVAVIVRWSLPLRQLDECSAVFAWARMKGLLTPEVAEVRTRAALQAGNSRLAREFAADVPTARIAPLLQWVQLLEAPYSILNQLASHTALPVEPDALEAGFTRLLRSDFAAASMLLPQLLTRDGLTPALRGRLQRAAALAEAYAHDSGALAAFTRLPAEALDDQAQEWRARTALWVGDYRQARTWIDEMPSSIAAQPRWRYWRARAVAATAGTEAAAPLFTQIAGLRDYYGYLAADRLNQDYRLNIRSAPDDKAAQASLATEPGLRRAHALLDCEMTDEASVEWAVALSEAKPALKIQAARLAASWGWHAQSISTLAQAGEWDDVTLRYPRPYLEAITDASRLTRVPNDWILAVMRQESLFRKDAVSSANARGLMQLLPATAAAVARRWHLPVPAYDSLFDPSVAAKLGAAYLRELLDRYGGQLGVSLAAYNAGPRSVARWIPVKAVDADIWIENIPYTETRGYVQHILEHIVAFAAVRDAEPPRLRDLLPMVGSYDVH